MNEYVSPLNGKSVDIITARPSAASYRVTATPYNWQPDENLIVHGDVCGGPGTMLVDVCRLLGEYATEIVARYETAPFDNVLSDRDQNAAIGDGVRRAMDFHAREGVPTKTLSQHVIAKRKAMEAAILTRAKTVREMAGRGPALVKDKDGVVIAGLYPEYENNILTGAVTVVMFSPFDGESGRPGDSSHTFSAYDARRLVGGLHNRCYPLPKVLEALLDKKA